MTPSFVLTRRIVAGVMLALSVVASAFGATVKFDIPAQAAPAALQLFMQQSGTQVMFVADEIRQVTTQAVKGEFEPAAALAVMLRGTGYTAVENKPGWFAVVRDEARKVATTGSVRGSLVRESGVPAVGVTVELKETGRMLRTDRNGEFFFGTIAPGTYLLVATAEGCQQLHVTDVVVKAGSDLVLSKETMRSANGALELAPYVVRAESVEQLATFEVTDTRAKPFSDANVDVPRTINDAQPYYIFDSKTITSSGATNLEDLLKQRLTMNTVAFTNGQTAGAGATMGNISTVNLRGLGADKTLILVNGRRQAGVTNQDSVNTQPDLNGIPLDAIERIEVLPTSASGIYGGGAIGGVVNVILKKDYTGGEIRATYDNTWKTDSPRRSVSLSFGTALEGGRTHLSLSASWTDARPLLLQDRKEVYMTNLATIRQNAPDLLSSPATAGWTGNLPNIQANPSSSLLTLKNGVSLGSSTTFIAAGTSPSTSTADLYASLLANAGRWNTDLPVTTQAPNGLLLPFGVTPKDRAVFASVRRQMMPALEVFADFSYTENNSTSVFNPVSSARITVPAAAPTNPFTTAVRITFPSTQDALTITRSSTRNATVGAIVQLPHHWTGEADYSWSRSRYFNSWRLDLDTAARDADILSGAFNPFVDTLRYPVNIEKYLSTTAQSGGATLDDIAFRGSGPVPALPWAEAGTLALGLERRIEKVPRNIYSTYFPYQPARSNVIVYFPREQTTDSGYGEAILPLVKRDRFPGVYAFDLQASGRIERYSVDAGTASETRTAAGVTYNSPTLNGLPYFTTTRYRSTDHTVGFKYQPTADLSLRASRASAFLPPAPFQLIKNPEPSSSLTPVTDPRTGNLVNVVTIGGGNPGLKPQSSKSTNAGIIWEPRGPVLKGLRLDAEYYKVEQFDAISFLDAQQFVNQESAFPGRVTRDAGGAITQVDTSYVNLFHRVTEGWDLSADYARKTPVGTFTVSAVESIILHLRSQITQTQPETEAAGYHPREGGAPKRKFNINLRWEGEKWTVGWTMRYFGPYYQVGFPGGPFSLQYANGGTYNRQFYILPQGSDTVPSQAYHDLFLGYAFGKPEASPRTRLRQVGSSLLDRLTVQVGVRNVFDKVPPLDAYYFNNYYISPYGDMRLRTYWVSLRKQF